MEEITKSMLVNISDVNFVSNAHLMSVYTTFNSTLIKGNADIQKSIAPMALIIKEISKNILKPYIREEDMMEIKSINVSILLAIIALIT